jgi:hypothetical protein
MLRRRSSSSRSYTAHFVNQQGGRAGAMLGSLNLLAFVDMR